MLSLHIPGASLVHRAPAWVKLLLLCLSGTAVMFVSSPLVLALALALVLIGYAVARIPVRALWRMTRGVLLFVVIIAACQWYFSTPLVAAVVCLRILYLLAGANLLTVTTQMSDLISTVETLLTPLARFGVRPERVGIAVALPLRFIPVITEQGARIREAQAARGVKARFTYLVPLIIRTLRMADGVGEALDVRGFGATREANQAESGRIPQKALQ